MSKIKTLTVYLGSSGHCRDIFKESAQKLGEMIAAHSYNLVYGGMDTGLMGILARTAQNNGAHVTGIIPTKLKDSERMMKNLSDLILVEELCDRKKKMFKMANAILALPGGFGTVDEALEILYWGGLKLHKKPLMLINIDGYWNDMIAYIRSLPDFNPAYLIVVDTLEEVFPALESWEAPEIVTDHTSDHYPHFEDEICRNTKEPIIIDGASIENTYYGVCALGLKQLSKHDRGIGFLNTDGQFDKLASWIESAAKERFITPKCTKLFAIEKDEELLRTNLKNLESVEINLHAEKWGD